MAQSVSVLLGTTKGAFILDSDVARADWTVRGPLCNGWPINHVIGDPETGQIWAAGGGAWEGAGVWRLKTDGDWTLSRFSNGQMNSWVSDNPEMAEHFQLKPEDPAPFTGDVDSVWVLARSGETVYAGTRPANLYASGDGGESWNRLDRLAEHPTREDWQPGGAGLVLHTIVTDPDDVEKLWLGVSAAGVFATEDAGASFDRRVRRSNAAADVLPGADPHEIGFCVHNMVRAPDNGKTGRDLLYQQNHHGVFRSPDGGRSWTDISAGLPSQFGFPIAVHPRDADKIWVVPMNGDSIGRFPPEASAAVWRSRDGGESWSAGRQGLPQRDCFFTVLRQAMATDRCNDVGLYFGTNSGSVFASLDEGETWREIARHLPTILSVETLQTE